MPPTPQPHLPEESSRPLLGRDRVSRAVRHYEEIYDRINTDDAYFQDMLARRVEALEERQKEYGALIYTLEHKIAPPDKAEAALLGNLHYQTSIIEEAVERIRLHSEEIKLQLIDQAGKMLDICRDNLLDDAQYEESYTEDFYEQSRQDTLKYYKALDRLYEAGEERVLDEPNKRTRAIEDLLTPDEVRFAKWKIFVAVSDAENDIDLSRDSASAKPDDLRADLVAHVYTELSRHERGADNKHMPYTHKLRHNPAVHSMHVATLMREIFDEARKKLETSGEFGALGEAEREQALEQLQERGRKLMFAALLHDAGEIHGELSQGIHVSRMGDGQKKDFEEIRGKKEEAIFSEFLDTVREKHYAAMPETAWESLTSEFMEGFRTAEDLQSFDGRLLKSVERLQSQHDYQRFNGMSGAMPLSETEEVNRLFSMNYPADTFFDKKIYISRVEDEEGHTLRAAKLDTNAPSGPNALENFIEAKDDAITTLVNRAIYDAAYFKYKWTEQKQIKTYALDDNAVEIVGRTLPKRPAPGDAAPEEEAEPISTVMPRQVVPDASPAKGRTRRH